MKKILITGANSYIGMSFEQYLKKWTNEYQVTTLDMISESWGEKSFLGFDSVYHVAGIAHSDSGKISPEKERLYREINTELAIKTAKKAKTEGVKQFIFMSSAIIYGDSAPIGKQKVITRETKPSPANCYGDSKLQAEIGLQKLEDESFKIVILRPPMIYGKDCKGNYPILAKLALKLPIFPKVNNCRSMLYIENLCEFVRLMIVNEEHGVFWPQNAEYCNTSELVKMIGEAHGKHVNETSLFNWVLPIIGLFSSLINKAFGNLTYAHDMSIYKKNYQFVSLKSSISKIESGNCL